MKIPVPVAAPAPPPPPSVETDEITVFLKNIESTLRRFSGRFRAIAKRRINDVVSDLEMEFYSDTQQPAVSHTAITPTRAPLHEMNGSNFNWSFMQDAGQNSYLV